MSAAIKIHELITDCQNGKQQIEVLRPDDYDASKQYRVLYLLPVEKGFESEFGYGLDEMADLDAHNRYQLIIVQMGFELIPWYGDHPTDSRIRQASYLKDYVVPYMEKKYAARPEADARLLFGFSKSGWGAFSLIMRDLAFWGYAAAWDAPMLLEEPVYGMEAIYEAGGNLESYRPDLLAQQADAYFKERSRLVLGGETTWGESIPTYTGQTHTQGMHAILNEHGVKHHYDSTLNHPHRWEASWMKPMLEALMNLTNG